MWQIVLIPFLGTSLGKEGISGARIHETACKYRNAWREEFYV